MRSNSWYERPQQTYKQGLQDVICLTDSFVFMPDHCVNFQVMRYESTGLNRIVGDNPGYKVSRIYHELV